MNCRTRLKESQFTLISPSKGAVDDDSNLSYVPSTEIFKKNYKSAGFITAIDSQDGVTQILAICTKLIFLYEEEQVTGLPRSLTDCE